MRSYLTESELAVEIESAMTLDEQTEVGDVIEDDGRYWIVLAVESVM